MFIEKQGPKFVLKSFKNRIRSCDNIIHLRAQITANVCLGLSMWNPKRAMHDLDLRRGAPPVHEEGSTSNVVDPIEVMTDGSGECLRRRGGLESAAPHQLTSSRKASQ